MWTTTAVAATTVATAMAMAQCFGLLLQGGRLGGPHVMHLAARCRRRRLSMVAHPLHPSPLRARENHGGQDRGDEAASHGRGEREEQSSDGVQDTGRGRRGTALAAASQRCDATNRAHDEHQTAPAREYRHRNPAAEPPAHPGRAGPGPRGAAIAVVHLCLRSQSKARPG